MPEGWRRLASDNEPKVVLVDDNGFPRVFFRREGVYSKSAPRVVLLCRVSIVTRLNEDMSTTVNVRDGSRIMKSFYVGTGPLDWKEFDRAMREAERWTEKNFPDWHNPRAYWGCDGPLLPSEES